MKLIFQVPNIVKDLLDVISRRHQHALQPLLQCTQPDRDRSKLLHPVFLFLADVPLWVTVAKDPVLFTMMVLFAAESLRWLNHLVERIWPICMENIVSQKIILPMMPWFLQKFKPWTVKEVMVQNLYMGRSPPMITEMRVCCQSTGDDHLVTEKLCSKSCITDVCTHQLAH